MVKWAVYYCTCAMLYVLDRIPDQTDDTPEELLLKENPGDFVPHDAVPTWDDIKNDYNAKYGHYMSRDNKVKVTDTIANVTITIGIIIPVFALAILPIAAKIIKDIDTKPPQQDPNEQPPQPIPIPIPA